MAGYRTRRIPVIRHNVEYDPDFFTDSYGLSDMEPSPHRPSAAAAAPSAAAASGSASKKKRTKARAQKLPTTEVCEEFAPGRTNYSDPESIVLTRCWIDVSEDPVYANNQRVTAYWERIAEKYNAAKPANAYKRHREQLRKHWDQIKKHVNLFAAEYEKCEREQASGESLADVRDKAMQSYISLYGDFKHYQSWALLRDKQKFVGGVIPQSTAARRASKRTFNNYTSSDSGASPMDLNSPVFEDESSGTPMSSRRPSGVKAAKGKGKATSSSVALPEQAPSPTPSSTPSATSTAAHAYADLAASSDYRTLLDTHTALMQATNPAQIEGNQRMIDGLSRKLGLL